MSKTKQISPTKLKPGMLLMLRAVPGCELAFSYRIISVERRKNWFSRGYHHRVVYADLNHPLGRSSALFHAATEILPAEMATILIENPKSTKMHEPRS